MILSEKARNQVSVALNARWVIALKMYILSAFSLCRSLKAIVWQNGDARTLSLFHCIKIYQNRTELKQSILFHVTWNFYIFDWHIFILFFILSSCRIESIVVVPVYRHVSHSNKNLRDILNRPLNILLNTISISWDIINISYTCKDICYIDTELLRMNISIKDMEIVKKNV